MWHINSSSSARPLRPTNSSSGFVRKWQKISGRVVITGVVIAACLSRLKRRNQKNSLFHHRLQALRKTPARCRFLFQANFSAVSVLRGDQLPVEPPLTDWLNYVFTRSTPPDRLHIDTSLIKRESFHDLFIPATPSPSPTRRYNICRRVRVIV